MVLESRVPMTLREPFFQDPFFKTAWEDFERVREEMMRESREFWRRAENDMRPLENSSSSMSSSSRMVQKQQRSSSSNRERERSSSRHRSGEDRASSSSELVPWFFPRRWMTPRWLVDDDDDFFGSRMRSLDLFQDKDEQVVRLTDDDAKFEVSLDTHGYRPDEIRINVRGDLLTVEGKHEEKSDNRSEMRQFSRTYSLPRDCPADRVNSNLSSDGILMITAPKRQAVKYEGNRSIPIERK